MTQIETFESLQIVDEGGRSLISALDAKKISFPNDGADFGNSGDQLRSLGNGGVEWAAPGMPTYEQTEQAISDWLNDHPEATTTVQDGSITEEKLSSSLRQQYESDINELKDAINSNCNVLNYGAKEQDATVDWQAIIDEIAAIPNNDTIYFPAGKWYISEPLVIPSTIFKVIGTFAEIIAVETIPTMMVFEAESAGEINHIEGFHFYCNNEATNCLEVATASTHTTVNDCKFRDFTGFGCKCNYIGTMLQNCEFVSDHGSIDSIGFYGSTDVVISGCKFYYCAEAVKASSVTATGCYIWGGRANKKSIAFSSLNDSSVMVLDCVGNELDACISFFKNVSGNVSSNRILVNFSDAVYTDEQISLFESTANYAHTYSAMTFCNNEIRYISNESDFGRDCHTFRQADGTSNFCFKSYSSENNQHYIANRTVNDKYIHYGYGLAFDPNKPHSVSQYVAKVALIGGKTSYTGGYEYKQANTVEVIFNTASAQNERVKTFVNTASKRPAIITPIVQDGNNQAFYFTTYHEFLATRVYWSLGTYFEFVPTADSSMMTDTVSSVNNFVAVLAS